MNPWPNKRRNPYQEGVFRWMNQCSRWKGPKSFILFPWFDFILNIFLIILYMNNVIRGWGVYEKMTWGQGGGGCLKRPKKGWRNLCTAPNTWTIFSCTFLPHAPLFIEAATHCPKVQKMSGVCPLMHFSHLGKILGVVHN